MSSVSSYGTLDYSKIVELRDVSVMVSGRHVLKDISFIVNSGDRIIILGPNGSGKTTLIRTMIYLVRPFSGRVVWYVNDGVMVNLEELFNIPSVTDRDMIDFLIKCLDNCDVDLLNNLMKNFDVTEDILDTPIQSLSTGQRKMLTNIIALSCGLNLAILDEPFEGLDPYRKSILVNILTKLDSVKGVILVTHETTMLKRLDNWKTYIMVEGRLYGPVITRDLLRAGVVHGYRDDAILRIELRNGTVSLVIGEGEPLERVATLDELYRIVMQI